MYSRLDTVCKYLLSIEVINGWGRQTWVSLLGPCACFLVRLQYIQRFCPRQPHGRKAQSLLECPAKWRLSDAGEVQSQWMRRAESDARHHTRRDMGIEALVIVLCKAFTTRRIFPNPI